MSDSAVTMYGTAWCSDCRRSKKVLEGLGVAYTYIDIEQDEAAAEYVVQVNNGSRSVPTIVFSDGSVLVEPANQVLTQKLVDLGLTK